MKILVVDDEPLVRRALQRAFESKGHQVLTCENGEQALSVWESANPDLVFLDILMPGLSGPEVLQSLGSQKKCPVILMSAFSGPYDHGKAQEFGADHFLAKPFEDIFQVVSFAESLKKN